MKLLERVEMVARRARLADATIKVYLLWIRQFVAFSAQRHGRWTTPAELGTADVEAFLNHLVQERRLSASSQNQALNAIVFLYERVVEDIRPDHLGDLTLLRSRRKPRVPTVLSAEEVAGVIGQMPERGNYRLMVKLLYGTGMRVGAGA
jgi:site-specific recombinase XerD